MKLVLSAGSLDSALRLVLSLKAQAPDHSAVLPGSKRNSLDKMTSKGLSSSNIL